jgi:hypothetical protein
LAVLYTALEEYRQVHGEWPGRLADVQERYAQITRAYIHGPAVPCPSDDTPQYYVIPRDGPKRIEYHNPPRGLHGTLLRSHGHRDHHRRWLLYQPFVLEVDVDGQMLWDGRRFWPADTASLEMLEALTERRPCGWRPSEP